MGRALRRALRLGPALGTSIRGYLAVERRELVGYDRGIMSVYARFKRNPEGFRQLVELLESTPPSRRKKMIDVGMAEDPVYTQRAIEYMMTFEDVLKLPDMELAEVIATTPARMIAYSLGSS